MFANAAHAHGVPCIVDNTFPTPINCRPFEFGVDIVTHSTTKYLDGHAVQLGGAIVDSGNFDWNNGKFPEFTEPDESYHGIVYAEHFGKAAYIAKARCHLMRDIGAQAAPMNAFYLNLGMETASRCAWSAIARTHRRSPNSSSRTTAWRGSTIRVLRAARTTSSL